MHYFLKVIKLVWLIGILQGNCTFSISKIISNYFLKFGSLRHLIPISSVSLYLSKLDKKNNLDEINDKSNEVLQKIELMVKSNKLLSKISSFILEKKFKNW